MIELETMKKVELEMMKQIHAFCVSNNIRYSLGNGTLLGAIRHKGFIPWDDDIDLLMPFPDYERFVTTFKTDTCKVASSLDSRYTYPYAKVYDTRTYLREHLRCTYPDMGVFIDIFPVGGLPSSRKQQDKLYAQQKFLYKLHMSMKYPFSMEWTFKKNCLLVIARFLSLFLPLQKVIGKLEKNYSLYPFEHSEEVAVLLGRMDLAVIPKTSFDQLVTVPFEDTEFYAIPDWDHWLTNQYGDYMTPPPGGQQVTHHRYDSGWIS